MNVLHSKAEMEIREYKFSHTWIIHKITAYKRHGEQLLSKCFSDDRDTNNKWQLSLFPYGEHEYQPYPDVALFLIPVRTKSYPIHLDCTIKVKAKDGNLVKIAEFYNHKYRREVQHGFSTLIRHDKLSESDGLLDTDMFTLRCELVIKKLVEKPKVTGLSDDLEYFLKRDILSDVILLANGEEVKAHKVILASRSQVFEAMFTHNMIESTNGVVNIQDMSSAVLTEMVYYIYTGKLRDTTVGAAELLVAADKYALDGLKAICEETLSKNISENNAATYLILADCYNASTLKAFAVNYISREASIVVATKEWKSLLQTHPHLTTDVFVAMDMSLNASVTVLPKRLISTMVKTT